MASKTPRSSGERGAAAVAAAVERFAAERLAEILPRQRWFGGKGRRIRRASVLDAAALAGPVAGAHLLLVGVAFEDGPDETYAVPLLARAPGAAGDVLGRLAVGGGFVVVDAFDEPEFCRALLAAFDEGATLPARRGTIRFARAPGVGRLATATLASRRLRGEQSNTSVIYGDALILKAFRKLERGPSPEHEMTGFLTSRARYPHVPQLVGAGEYTDAEGRTTTLAVLHRFVASQGDGWTWVLTHLERLRDFVATRARHEPLEAERLRQLVRDFSAGVLAALRRLGTLTGGLHAALASDRDDPAFAPEPIGPADVARWGERMADDLARTLAALRAGLPALEGAGRRRAQALVTAEASLRAALRGLDALVAEGCSKVRIHGDYHLGQTLRTEDDFVILDFEGEPARPLEERRAKACVLRDVAGMLRSFDYASASAFGGVPELTDAADAWRTLAAEAFLDGYLGAVAAASVRLVPASPGGLAGALAAFELDKALYEIRYEIDNRPAWVEVPLRGLDRLRSRASAA